METATRPENMEAAEIVAGGRPALSSGLSGEEGRDRDSDDRDRPSRRVAKWSPSEASGGSRGKDQFSTRTARPLRAINVQLYGGQKKKKEKEREGRAATVYSPKFFSVPQHLFKLSERTRDSFICDSDVTWRGPWESSSSGQ